MATNKGFGVVEVIVAILIIGLIAFIGWRVWDANSVSDSSQSTSQSGEGTATDVKSDNDLDKAVDTLDTTDIEGTESQDLDAQTNF